MNDSNLTLEELRQVLALAKEHGVTEMHYRGMKLARVAEADAAKPKSAAAQSVESILANMPADSVDRLLMLQRTKGGV